MLPWLVNCLIAGRRFSDLLPPDNAANSMCMRSIGKPDRLESTVSFLIPLPTFGDLEPRQTASPHEPTPRVSDGIMYLPEHHAAVNFFPDYGLDDYF